MKTLLEVRDRMQQSGDEGPAAVGTGFFHMSYIFEALQRAEAERSGGSPPKNADSVADLLQKVEEEIDRKQSLSELPLAAKSESPGARLFASAKVLLPALAADARLVCLTDQGSLAAEKFRVLGLKLRHMRERRKLKRIVITSSIPEEGKSLIAANLALNQSRSKVLNTVLIDGDLRRPELGRRFGFSRNLPGLSEVLRGERQLSEVVYKLEGSGLWFIPAGVTPENPIEVMQAGRLQQLLEQLGNIFRLDYYRYSSGASPGGYTALDEAGGWSAAGNPRGRVRKEATGAGGRGRSTVPRCSAWL